MEKVCLALTMCVNLVILCVCMCVCVCVCVLGFGALQQQGVQDCDWRADGI